jgi:hypothetical protein
MRQEGGREALAQPGSGGRAGLLDAQPACPRGRLGCEPRANQELQMRAWRASNAVPYGICVWYLGVGARRPWARARQEEGVLPIARTPQGSALCGAWQAPKKARSSSQGPRGQPAWWRGGPGLLGSWKDRWLGARPFPPDGGARSAPQLSGKGKDAGTHAGFELRSGAPPQAPQPCRVLVRRREQQVRTRTPPLARCDGSSRPRGVAPLVLCVPQEGRRRLRPRALDGDTHAWRVCECAYGRLGAVGHADGLGRRSCAVDRQRVHAVHFHRRRCGGLSAGASAHAHGANNR